MQYFIYLFKYFFFSFVTCFKTGDLTIIGECRKELLYGNKEVIKRYENEFNFFFRKYLFTCI